MNSRDDVRFRLNLAEGFLKEAKQDFGLKRWRSCVANSQLAVENSGKTILALFGLASKSHDPAKHLAKNIHDENIPEEIRQRIKDLLPDLLILGFDEHILTDYGDESSYTLPWDLFDEDAARSSLETAKRAAAAVPLVVDLVNQWRSAS